MPFKIVQTKEENKIKLLVVPSGWESQNNLRWPRVSQNLKTIIRQENSSPNSDWETIKCKVKRTNIPSYQAANKIISEMMMYSDTEDDIPSPQRQQSGSDIQRPLDLNVLAAQIASPINVPIIHEPSSVMYPSQHSTENVYQLIISDNMTSNNTSPPEETVCFDVAKHFSNQNQILENQKAIIENQKQLSENQTLLLHQIESFKKIENNLIQKVASFSVQLENTVAQLRSLEKGQVSMLSAQTSHIDNVSFYVKPIENIQELDDLEKQLADKKIRNQLKNTYSLICSGGKGVDCAYSFIDRLFSRDFLCQCSWSGGSRTDYAKIPIKSYKQVLSFFWEMVNFWDNKFTLQDNESFFKGILRNSNKRKMAKNERSSTSRQRSIQVKSKKSKNQDTASEDTMKQLNKEDNIENSMNQINDNCSQNNKFVTENEDQKKDVEENDTEQEFEEEESLC